MPMDPCAIRGCRALAAKYFPTGPRIFNPVLSDTCDGIAYDVEHAERGDEFRL